MATLTLDEIVLLLVDAAGFHGIHAKRLEQIFKPACEAVGVTPMWDYPELGGCDIGGLRTVNALGYLEKHRVTSGGRFVREEYHLSDDGGAVVANLKTRFPKGSAKVKEAYWCYD